MDLRHLAGAAGGWDWAWAGRLWGGRGAVVGGRGVAGVVKLTSKPLYPTTPLPPHNLPAQAQSHPLAAPRSRV